MEIRRDTYLKQLIRLKQNGLIKVVTGIRRVGKSYLLNTIFYNYLRETGIADSHIIKLAFDNPDTDGIASPKELYDFIRSKITDTGVYYVIIDEVQMLPNFEKALNGLLYLNNVDVYVTGSNSRFLSSDILTEFRGRGDEIHVYPLSFAEFMSVYSGDKYEGLNDYLMYGGLPPVVLRDGDVQKAEYLKNLFKITYLRDIIARNRIRNTPVLEVLTVILASQIGSLTNPRRIINTFQSEHHISVSPNTMQVYLSALEEAYLVSCSRRYDIRGSRYIETPQKYYFEDTGLRNARLNFRQIEYSYLLENTVYNELRRRGFHVDVGSIDRYESNADMKSVRKHLEVDFVANLGYKRYYIQSVLTLHSPEKIVQEKKSLQTISDSFRKIIVTGDMIKSHIDENGIVILNIFDFLLNEQSLDLL